MVSSSIGRERTAMTVYACLKWITPPDEDARFGGLSPADRSALELALRIGEVLGESVTALTVGGASSDAGLREALSCGASKAVRADTTVTPSSIEVAKALASMATNASFVCCGDYSLDRGSGSVPVFLAAELSARQACGLVEVAVTTTGLDALRRLDGGRRERVRIAAPAVVSTEGATAPLRRAPLPAVLAARSARIEVRPIDVVGEPPATTSAYRPRARVLAGPQGATALERVMGIVAADSSKRGRSDAVALDPQAAVDRIIDSLHTWGYLE
jgi:electron transfer flavoprotein beta subunit